jgi:3-oxoacyl-[acyl-carrier protein] reductase
VFSELHDGGWTADAIAEQLAPRLLSELQSVGEKFRPLPNELSRPAS